MKTLVKTLILEPFVGNLYVVLTIFIAFLIGILYGGGDATKAFIDVGVWLGAIYITAWILYKLI